MLNIARSFCDKVGKGGIKCISLLSCSPPKSTDNFVALTIMFAVTTNSIGACLKQIPNEPIIFKVRLHLLTL